MIIAHDRSGKPLIADYTTDRFRILDITTEPQVFSEYREWAIKHLGIDKVPFKGAGQKVGVIDTGVDPYHQDLDGQVEAVNCIRGNKQIDPWKDESGHGTFCTGEIVAKENGKGVVGIAPRATALSCRVLYGDDRDNSRGHFDQDIADAIDRSTAEGCGVISMSLGGPGASVCMREALERAVTAGVIPVAAAGNERMEGSPYASYPAAYPTVISVAAANKHDLPMWYSTVGVGGERTAQPEIAIASLEYYWGCLPGQRMYAKMTGTSQATPMVAGVALLWREARLKLFADRQIPFPSGVNVLAEFRAWLQRAANDTNKNGWDPELGYGVLLLEPGEFPGV